MGDCQYVCTFREAERVSHESHRIGCSIYFRLILSCLRLLRTTVDTDYKGKSSQVSSTCQLGAKFELTNPQHSPQLLVLDLSSALGILHQDQSVIYHQLRLMLIPHSSPVHLCAASLATFTASFFLSYLTGSAAPKAANSDLRPEAVSLTSRRVRSNFARSS